MTTERQGADGRWLPDEPLPEPFGIRWECAWKHRRSLGEGWLRSLVASFLDTRTVDRITAP